MTSWFHSRFLRWPLVACLMVAWCAMPVSLLACPFCSAPSLTLTEQLVQSDAAVLVAWSGGKPAEGTNVGTTDYKVVDIAINSKEFPLKKDQVISLPRHRVGEAGQLALLLGTKGPSGIDWASPLDVTEASYGYLKSAPPPSEPTTQRLRYFVKYLEHADQAVSSDAYGEFANAAYADITPLAKELPRQKLRNWLQSPETAPSRLGLYGLLLGLCGEPSDRSIMEDRIFVTAEDFRLGIDGIMGGYLLLTGEEGLQKLDEKKLIDKKVPFSETYAAMQAIRFMWQYGDGKIPVDRLKQSMRILLSRPELADLVIADLARMQDWTVQADLMKLYEQPEYDIPSIKRAIVRFLLASVKAGEKETAEETAPHAREAQALLAQLETKDPKTVRDAKRFYFITK